MLLRLLISIACLIKLQFASLMLSTIRPVEPHLIAIAISSKG
jgi:hypothetical protein